MFRTPTTLIVGAGASCEARFPAGDKLLQLIGRSLDFEFELQTPLKGDRVIAAAIIDAARKQDDDPNRWIRAAWRIRDAAANGLSIDNIIEQHDHDPLVREVGKIAIVRTIIDAESNSLMRVDPNRYFDRLNVGTMRETWFGRFMRVLTEGVPRSKLEHLFDNLRIVSFNYDRSIERFFPEALVVAYGLTIVEARQLVDRVPILHPYGQIAPLSWSDTPGGAGATFGAMPAGGLAAAATNIRTFSERIEDEQALAAIRDAVSSARQLVFLGFAFHRQNIELLQPANPTAERILATVMGLPANEKSQIVRQLLPLYAPGWKEPILHDGDCASLFSDNWRTLSG